MSERKEEPMSGLHAIDLSTFLPDATGAHP
jgi:hypothetical protein